MIRALSAALREKRRLIQRDDIAVFPLHAGDVYKRQEQRHADDDRRTRKDVDDGAGDGGGAGGQIRLPRARRAGSGEHVGGDFRRRRRDGAGGAQRDSRAAGA